ncbi:MAG: hypothetical protein ACP5II_03875 [Infirmifilum sp.]|jgi:putative transposase|uniref:hypothetical protein n=1 Tax=Infirmifilum sp. TaxID=2856575 RepID=UPI003D147ACC
MCKTGGLEVNADINECLNIAHKTGYSPPTQTRIEAYTPICQGIIDLTKKKKIQPPGEKHNPQEEQPREPAPSGAG